MRILTTKTIGVTTMTETGRFCDKCKKEIILKRHEVFECTVSISYGDFYPEGGSGEKRTIDLCGICGEQLMDMLKGMEYRINESEW